MHNFCPFDPDPAHLNAHGFCAHFVGWTDDGRTIQRLCGERGKDPVELTDRVITTGVSARVYRQTIRSTRPGMK